MTSGISFPLEFSNYTCEPYSSSYASYLNRFDLLDVKDENGNIVHYEELERDIRDAGRLSDANIFKTYLVFYNSKDNKKELACVFCIRCSSMHFRNFSKEIFFSEIIPCIELVYLGVDANYARKHPDIKRTGGMVFDKFIVDIVLEVNRLCGCKYLFLFAINDKKLIKYYIDRMDFKELPAAEEEIVVEYLKTYSNQNCKFLFQDIACM